jgi:hypothetical protein
MVNCRSTQVTNLLSITALVLSFGALQSPLWRPAVTTPCVTATVGGTAVLAFDGQIDRASIFQKKTATLSSDGPGRLIIHGRTTGTTNLLLRYKDGDSKLYEIVVLPG